MPKWNININKEFDDFKRLFDEGKSVFLTGKAGTEKSTPIKQIISKTDKNIVVVAPTGTAAVNNRPFCC
jgi:ABC-type ATPase involved in cell division